MNINHMPEKVMLALRAAGIMSCLMGGFLLTVKPWPVEFRKAGSEPDEPGSKADETAPEAAEGEGA